MAPHAPMEVAKTVLEVADVAWTALEICHHHQHEHGPTSLKPEIEKGGNEIESLRSENQRLRDLLEKNLNLIEQITSSPNLVQNCPSDLHERLLNAVNSESFLNELNRHRGESVSKFPFEDPSGADLEKAEVLISVDHEEPSWWVWVSDDMVPKNSEEKSGIDSESYVVVTEDHVVEGVANFMAICILAHPKAQNVTPHELQRALTKALGPVTKVEKMLNIWSAGKLLYTLATWGLMVAGIYQGRAVLRLATHAVHHSTKLALKVL